MGLRQYLQEKSLFSLISLSLSPTLSKLGRWFSSFSIWERHTFSSESSMNQTQDEIHHLGYWQHVSGMKPGDQVENSQNMACNQQSFANQRTETLLECLLPWFAWSWPGSFPSPWDNMAPGSSLRRGIRQDRVFQSCFCLLPALWL